MATSSASAPTPAPGELVFTHRLSAPRELVFRILTDPKHVAEWSGSKGFTDTFDERGGNTKLTLHARVTRATAVAVPYLARMEQGGNRSIERLAAYIAIKSKEQLI